MTEEQSIADSIVATIEFPDWSEIRTKRNELLTESDWVVTKSLEQGFEVPSEWKDYRQRLRDITEVFDRPEDVVFPSRP